MKAEGMGDPKKIVALVGSYRKGGVIDTTIDELLSSAREHGAETEKIYLTDRHIEFCTNCRTCTQQAGADRGECVFDDEMSDILVRLQAADAIVLGSPMNFGTVTAVTKRFIERLVCFAYWPWGMNAPKMRNEAKPRLAVVVASSAAPAIIARLFSRMVKLLKDAVELLGTRVIGVVFVGLAAKERRQDIGEKARMKARRLGKKLASAN